MTMTQSLIGVIFESKFSNQPEGNTSKPVPLCRP